MNSRTLFFFWIIFWIIYILGPADPEPAVWTRDLISFYESTLTLIKSIQSSGAPIEIQQELEQYQFFKSTFPSFNSSSIIPILDSHDSSYAHLENMDIDYGSMRNEGMIANEDNNTSRVFNQSCFFKGSFVFEKRNSSQIYNKSTSERDSIFRRIFSHHLDMFSLSLHPNQTMNNETAFINIFKGKSKISQKSEEIDYARNAINLISSGGLYDNDNMNKKHMHKEEIETNNQLQATALNLHTLELKNSTVQQVQWVEGHFRFKKSEIWGLTGYNEDEDIYNMEGVFIQDKSLAILHASPFTFFDLSEIARIVPSSDLDAVKKLTMIQIKEKLRPLKHNYKSDTEHLEKGTLSTYNLFQRCSYQIYIKFDQVPTNETEVSVKLDANVLIYSPDCGLLLQSPSSSWSSTNNKNPVPFPPVGLTYEYYWIKCKRFALMLSALLFAQCLLMIYQKEFSSTQSALSRISPWTICCFVLIDAGICLTTFTSSVVFQTVFSPFIVCAFLSFVAFSIIGLRYQLGILQVLNRTPDQAEASLASKYTFFIFFAFMIIYQGMMKSTLVTLITVFALYSFWIPQIISNIKRNSRKAFSKEFLIAYSACRLILPIYVFGCPKNIIDYGQSSLVVVTILSTYVALQTVVLLLHDLLGPRFLLPTSWFPEAYNYHPVLPAGDEEAPTDHTQTSGNESTPPEINGMDKDCAICFVPVDTRPDTSSFISSRLNYMVTPCHHLFHSDCLERWMDVKLECPVCRAPLPPI